MYGRDEQVGRQKNLPENYAWISNPLLNIAKTIQLQKLRREVSLRRDHGLTRIQLLARLIRETDKTIPVQRTKRNLTCSQPILGRWINDCDYPFLVKTLALPDILFQQEFRGIRLSQEQRQIIANLFDSHSKECARCSAKRAEDEKYNGRARALAENKHIAPRVLAA